MVLKKAMKVRNALFQECFDELIKELKHGYFIKEENKLENSLPISIQLVKYY